MPVLILLRISAHRLAVERGRYIIRLHMIRKYVNFAVTMKLKMNYISLPPVAY